MVRQAPSIFNDVIGPVMLGPSSSHTAGPARIGKLASQLLHEKLRRAQLDFEANGSFAMCYRGQRSDIGFAGGLLGWRPEDPRLAHALTTAKEEGIEIVFNICSFPANHPNTVKITLTGENGETATLTALSIGGGMVEIIEINGLATSISGDFYELLVFLREAGAEQVEEMIKAIEAMGVRIEFKEVTQSGDRHLINIKSCQSIPASVITALQQWDNVSAVRQLEPVLPTLSRRDCRVPFRTAEEMLRVAEEQGFELWEVAAHYEAMRGGTSIDEVVAKMQTIIATMKKSVVDGLNQRLTMQGILRPQAHLIETALAKGKLIPTGVLDTVTAWAMAAVEVNNSLDGVIVAAPTAGSCGVLPGALLGTAKALGLDAEAEAKAMLAAGGIGLLIAEQATFSAEVAGCQAECGAGSTMAAAGVVQLAGGSVAQGISAASIAMQNILGLICDPVAEHVEVPCLGKNVMAAANAITAANMALAGVDPVIPLDEVIQAMFHVGNMLPRELRCTGLGGVAITKTGQKIKADLANCTAR